MSLQSLSTSLVVCLSNVKDHSVVVVYTNGLVAANEFLVVSMIVGSSADVHACVSNI